MGIKPPRFHKVLICTWPTVGHITTSALRVKMAKLSHSNFR